MYIPHSGVITKLVWDEKKQILYSGSKDKTVRVWKLPESWNRYVYLETDKLGPQAKSVEPPAVAAEAKKEGEAKKDEEVQDLSGEEDEEDEDDLSGWAK